MCISCYNRAFDAETSKSPDERLGAAVTFSLPINQSTIGTLAIVCLSRIYTVFNDIIVNSKLSLISTLSRQRCLPALNKCINSCCLRIKSFLWYCVLRWYRYNKTKQIWMFNPSWWQLHQLRTFICQKMHQIADIIRTDGNREWNSALKTLYASVKSLKVCCFIICKRRQVVAIICIKWGTRDRFCNRWYRCRWICCWREKINLASFT